MPAWARAVRAAVAFACCGTALASTADHPRLRVCLVAGTELPAYQAGRAMELLQRYLETNYAMQCTRLHSAEGASTFDGPLARLHEADTAVFFVRRKAPLDADLAEIRHFVDSGKGFVALRTTSHAWENWPAFDEEVLGAHYAGRFGAGKPLEVINLHQHPIFTGARGFQAPDYGYAYERIGDDVQIVMEGVIGEAATPLAWVRRHRAGRIFHLVPGGIERFSDETYLRIVANGLLWVAGRPIPGATASVQRTYMPDAHPGAFAITFPQGPGVCYDPVRGGINYVWDGDFVDLRPRWLTKRGEPARVFGAVFHREPNEPAVRRGPSRLPVDFQWLGYRVNGAAVELRYTIDGHPVVEEMRALPGGAGLVRRFQVAAALPPLWFMHAAVDAHRVGVAGATIEERHVRYDGNGPGEFTLTLRRAGEPAP